MMKARISNEMQLKKQQKKKKNYYMLTIAILGKAKSWFGRRFLRGEKGFKKVKSFGERKKIFREKLVMLRH